MSFVMFIRMRWCGAGTYHFQGDQKQYIRLSITLKTKRTSDMNWSWLTLTKDSLVPICKWIPCYSQQFSLIFLKACIRFKLTCFISSWCSRVLGFQNSGLTRTLPEINQVIPYFGFRSVQTWLILTLNIYFSPLIILQKRLSIWCYPLT